MSVHINVAAVGIAYTENGDFFGRYKKKLHQHFCVTLRHTVKFFVFFNAGISYGCLCFARKVNSDFLTGNHGIFRHGKSR